MPDNDFILFYAWQSDSPTADNRNFIESAAQKALKKVSQSGFLQTSPRLDRDTKDVPGTPDIANTILEKINMSSAFLADLTYVGKTIPVKGQADSLIPNPNVLLELGYALNRLSWQRLICVMNTYYGTEEDLPFDLRNRRWPIKYNLPPSADEILRKKIKEELADELETAIKAIAQLPQITIAASVEHRLSALESLVGTLSGSVAHFVSLENSTQRLASPAAQPDSVEDLSSRNLQALVTRIKENQFEGFKPDSGFLALVVSPAKRSIDKLQLQSKESNIRRLLKPIYCSGWDHRRHGTSLVTFSNWGGVIDAVSEITTEGIINAAGHQVITVDKEHFGELGIKGDYHVIPSVAFERNIIESVHDYLRLLIEFSILGPWSVAFALCNLRQSILYVGQHFSFDGRPFVGDSITPPPVIIPADTNVNSPQSIAKVLRPSFDFIWREHNYPESLNYSFDDQWTGR